MTDRDDSTARLTRREHNAMVACMDELREGMTELRIAVKTTQQTAENTSQSVNILFEKLDDIKETTARSSERTRNQDSRISKIEGELMEMRAQKAGENTQGKSNGIAIIAIVVSSLVAIGGVVVPLVFSLAKP